MTPISLITVIEIDGKLKLNPSWAELDNVARLDLLQDWIAALQQLYQRTHQDTYGHDPEDRRMIVAEVLGHTR
jgi:hypothetical protein